MGSVCARGVKNSIQHASAIGHLGNDQNWVGMSVLMDADFGPITRVFTDQVGHLRITVVTLANKGDLHLFTT